VPIENPEISEPTGIILLSLNHPSMPNSLVALFFSLRSLSVHEPISNLRTWPCATKSTFFAVQRGNARN